MKPAIAARTATLQVFLYFTPGPLKLPRDCIHTPCRLLRGDSRARLTASMNCRNTVPQECVRARQACARTCCWHVYLLSGGMFGHAQAGMNGVGPVACVGWAAGRAGPGLVTGCPDCPGWAAGRAGLGLVTGCAGIGFTGPAGCVTG